MARELISKNATKSVYRDGDKAVKVFCKGFPKAEVLNEALISARVEAIGGINIEPEQIDASALEDAITRYVKGRADTGGSFAVTVNFTSETVAEWTALITAYKALTGGNRMWFETVIPGEEKSFFVVAQPPEQIPQPEIGQNELLTIEMNLTIEEYKGLDSTVALTTGE